MQRNGPETSIDEANFVLSLIQELFPSWRYGSAFVKDFGQVTIQLQTKVVEYGLERLFSHKKYGGQVPLALSQKIKDNSFPASDKKRATP